MSYFASKTSGLKADVKRHADKEKHLREQIAAVEGKEDEASKVFASTYRHLLNQLLQSKADVASKIGKK